MVETSTPADVAKLPPPPRNPLTWRQQIHAVKAFHTGQEVLRDAGGHVTRLKNGPTWLTPEAVVATSPQAARDILGGTGSGERTPAHDEVRSLIGASLFTLKHDPWLPRRRARRRARAAAATMRRLAAEVLQACRDDPTRDAPLVRAMIAATDPATGRTLTDDEIRNELIVFMSAGHDTTATTLTYALWALGHHPDMQDKVRAETEAIGDQELTPDDVPRLRYTVQVLHEALRLCPPAPSIPRLITRDIEVDGYLVKAGTLCTVGVYAMHRDPALWDRPLEFDPDRFTPENTTGSDRWQYIPFSAGPRTCIGDHFAMLEATLALATIIRRTEIRSLNDDFPLALPFTMVAAAPIRAQVNARTPRLTERSAC